MFATRQRTVKHQLNRPNAGKESIHTEQQWPSQDVMVNDLYQGLDQALILLSGNDTTPPQTGIHYDRHCQRDDLALPLDMDIIHLYVLQVSRMLHQLLVNLLKLSSSSLLPIHQGTFAQMKVATMNFRGQPCAIRATMITIKSRGWCSR
jgi:hypothetical protein